MEGQGIYKFVEGGYYSGEWKDGKRDGQGICKYPDGVEYEGEYKNDEETDRGIYRFADEEALKKFIDENSL